MVTSTERPFLAKNRQKKLLTQTGINFAQGRVSTYIIISAHKTTEPLGLVGECVLLAPTIYLKQQDALSSSRKQNSLSSLAV